MGIDAAGVEDLPIDALAREAVSLGEQLAGQFSANGSQTLDAAIMLQRLGGHILAELAERGGDK